MAESWEDKKKSRKNAGLIISLCIAVIIVGFFVFNNRDIFNQSGKDADSVKVEGLDKAGQEKEPSEKGKPEEEEKVEEAVAQEESTEPAAPEKEPEKEIEIKKEPAEVSLHSLDLPTVKCALADKKGLFVQVSLKVYFREKKLEKEILFKRDNIKVVVKKVLFKKNLSEVVVEKLRIELKREINNLLEEGKIEDIEFIDFRPVENI